MRNSRHRHSNQGPKPKLLVVDDEPDNLDLLYRTFYREFKVLRAEDGNKALAILDSEPDVAVIISDQRMPGMSGTEFLSRTAMKHPEIMRIILTGYTDVEDLVGAINEGKVFKYVTKPWEDTELKGIVRQALDAHKVLKQRTAELNRVLRQETLLNAVTNTIRSAQTSQEMLQTIVNTLGRTMGASYCALQPFYGNQQTYQPAAPETFVYVDPQLDPQLVAQAEGEDIPQALAQTVWRTEAPLVLDQLQPSPQDSPELTPQQAILEQLGIQSTLLIPFVCKRELMAVLALHHCDERPWEPSEVQLLTTLADQAALALAQTYTYEQVQALAQRETLINTITTAIRSSLNPQETFSAITRSLGKALKVDGCALSLWTAKDDFVHCAGLYDATIQASAPGTEMPSELPQSQVPIADNPVLRRILTTQQPVVVDNLEHCPDLYHPDLPLRSPAQALLVVPLLTEGQIIGSISLRQTSQPRHWTFEEVTLVQGVASQAAIAVQQARLYQKTREQAEKLLELDRQKTEFFQNISHEFRTPLTLTLGPLEASVAQQSGLSYEQSVIALRNSRRLLRLVNQLLDIQRLDTGRMQPVFRPCDPVMFIQEVVEAFTPYCDRKALTLATDLPPSAPPLYLDLEKFDKVLYNLLSNAVKFTPAGGRITLRLEVQDQLCTVQVEDTGLGIRTDQIPYLFERFRQADGSSNRSYEGSGLGLALVKALVQLHGGDITVNSTFRQGTTFTLTLPLGKDHLPPHQVDETTLSLERQRALIELADIEESVSPADSGTSAPVNIDAVGETVNAPVILVADDNPDLRTYVTSILQRQGYHILTAVNGAHAYELAQAHHPHLILTDWMMPEVTGVELIQQVRSTPDLQSIPIILLTAKVDDETRITGVEQGADAYLGKPFNDRELLAEVRNLLALKANEKRVAELNRYLTQSVLQRFLPKSLVQKAAEGELKLELEPEPKLITILFTDIVGFTRLSDSLGPKRVAQLLNSYLDAMTQAIFEYGGTVDKFLGDGVLALFGAPEELEPQEQALRAIATVQRMHEKLQQLNHRLQNQEFQPLQFRCGIHQGTAVVGMFGSAERTDYTAIGPSVNMAARLQEVAHPNGILVSETVGQYLQPDWILETQPQHLKGIEAPITCLSVKVGIAGQIALATPPQLPIQSRQ